MDNISAKIKLYLKEVNNNWKSQGSVKSDNVVFYSDSFT